MTQLLASWIFSTALVFERNPRGRRTPV